MGLSDVERDLLRIERETLATERAKLARMEDILSIVNEELRKSQEIIDRWEI